MSRRLLIWATGILSGIMLAGCTDDSYRGTVDIDLVIERDIPHEVRMTIGQPADIVDGTKGSGVIADVSGFQGKPFYVYAFNKDGLTTLNTTSVQDSIRCLVDGSLDKPESLMGREALWNPNTEYVEWASGDGPIYYPMGDGSGLIYNFFAYYLDDMTVEESDFRRTENSVTIDIEIDGSQDIMSSKAEPTADQLAAIKDEKERVYRKYCSYSYYTALHGLHPNFVFKHHLVKFDFKLVPGGVSGATKNVNVEKIELVSKYKGAFTVADNNEVSGLGIQFYDDRKALELKEADGSDFIHRVITTFDGGSSVDGTIDDMGSLLVAPDVEYEMLITLSEEDEGNNVTHDPYPIVRSITMGTEEARQFFSAGNEYLITITVYGKMDVKVNTDILKWDEGGYYVPPTEDIPE